MGKCGQVIYCGAVKSPEGQIALIPTVSQEHLAFSSDLFVSICPLCYLDNMGLAQGHSWSLDYPLLQKEPTKPVEKLWKHDTY